MASPWLIKGQAAIRHASDLAQFTWIEESQAIGSSPGWQHWTLAQGQLALTPTRWLHFNYTYQMTQAALSGQGVVLARLPLVAENLERGELVEVLPGSRLLAAHAYWLVLAPRSKSRPEVQALRNWLLAQAELTRRSIGET
jgi:DNA-binding transcriptional LysR family regulator